ERLLSDSSCRVPPRCSNLEDAHGDRLVHLAPDVPISVGPGVDRAPAPNQIEEAGQIELPSRPRIQSLKPGDNHAVVERTPETVLHRQIPLNCIFERIFIWKYGAKGQERPGHP